MSQIRRQFTDEFKREAVALLSSSGRPLRAASHSFTVLARLIRRGASTKRTGALARRGA